MKQHKIGGPKKAIIPLRASRPVPDSVPDGAAERVPGGSGWTGRGQQCCGGGGGCGDGPGTAAAATTHRGQLQCPRRAAQQQPEGGRCDEGNHAAPGWPRGRPGRRRGHPVHGGHPRHRQ
uniref:(northern house mosquito) hypothetical protein n=1 Tax=Culex pipiens TaxID=7175 RepID=A0A8D8PF50_CULPI